MPELIDELRQLIIRAAPDPEKAQAVADCPPDADLDAVIPFSSVIVLGVVVALEDRYRIVVTRDLLAKALENGATLRSLARLVEAARGR